MTKRRRSSDNADFPASQRIFLTDPKSGLDVELAEHKDGVFVRSANGPVWDPVVPGGLTNAYVGLLVRLLFRRCVELDLQVSRARRGIAP